ncbi:MAG: hypothetical protein ACE5FY_08130 [Nitrospiria bacterium]
MTLKKQCLSPEEKFDLYCKDIDEWPLEWAGLPELDIPVGTRLIKEFKPFLLDLIHRDRSKGTVKKYASYLCCLGGEIMRRVDDSANDRKLPVRDLLFKYIDEEGGPLWRHARDERDHMAYDSVCRLLYKFMTKETA